MTKARPRVLVTGVGALIGQGIAHGLRLFGQAWTLGLDRRASLYAEQLCDATALKPSDEENSPAYLKFWGDLIDQYEIDLVIPGISIDMRFLDSHRDFFSKRGVALALNSSKLIELTEDKIAFGLDYAQLGLPIIPSVQCGTWPSAIEALGPAPLLLKPSVGEGSVGIFRLHDEVDFDYWTLKTKGDFLVQRIVGRDDEEYTVGTFGFGDGTYVGPIIFRRTLTRAGNTGEAKVVTHPVIADATHRIMQHYKPIGPTNLQFRAEDDRAFLLEINPRFSSSCSLRTAFGFNEAQMCVDFYLRGIRPPKPKLQAGFAQRYSADLIQYAGTDL